MDKILILFTVFPYKLVIEKVSGVIKVLYEPTRIRRKAKAEADALTTKEMQTTGLDRDDLKFLKRKITLTRLKNK